MKFHKFGLKLNFGIPGSKQCTIWNINASMQEAMIQKPKVPIWELTWHLLNYCGQTIIVH